MRPGPARRLEELARGRSQRPEILLVLARPLVYECVQLEMDLVEPAREVDREDVAVAPALEPIDEAGGQSEVQERCGVEPVRGQRDVALSIRGRGSEVEAMHRRDCCEVVTRSRALAGILDDVCRILYSLAMARTVPFTEARSSLSDLLDYVQAEQEHVVITRNGKRVALLMSMDEWESWEETFEVLQDEELLKQLKRSEEDVKAGRLVELDDVLRRHGRA